MTHIQIIFNKLIRKYISLIRPIFVKFFLWGDGNKNQAGFTHSLCRQNPDPYFHRVCGTNACLKIKEAKNKIKIIKNKSSIDIE